MEILVISGLSGAGKSCAASCLEDIGYYTVDSPPRKLRSIKITAYDRMAKFNRAYDTELAYPATLYPDEHFA